jgi:type I protein arginine methyltransferase
VLNAHAFILYFDTFFSPSGNPVPENTSVHLVKEGEPTLAEVWQVPGKSKRKDSTCQKGKEVSFSTGPLSTPTHWKHTLFLLREPIKVEEGKIEHSLLFHYALLSQSLNLGTTITGTFHCAKSADNSRELDVEIHYKVTAEGNTDEKDIVVQMYHVR